MDDATIEKRTKTVLNLLACRDPKYPKADFFLNLLFFTKDCLSKQPSVPHENMHERALRIMQDVARALALKLEAENQWQELMTGWYSSDIFDALSSRVLSSIFTNKELYTQFITHLRQSNMPVSAELRRYLQEFGKDS